MNEKHFAAKAVVALECNEQNCPTCFNYRGCVHDLNPAQPSPPFENTATATLSASEENDLLHRAA